TNVDARCAAVGEAVGALLVPVLDFAQEFNFGGVSLGMHHSGEPVPLVTLDSLNLPRCDLIKIDVEGMETAVVEGAAQTLARFQPVLYVENDRKEKSDELIRAIDRLGYTMHWHFPTLFT